MTWKTGNADEFLEDTMDDKMTEHVCEWEYRYIADKPRCRICLEYMGTGEMLRRLNATERLDIGEIKKWVTAQHILDMLQDYADMLESKND